MSIVTRALMLVTLLLSACATDPAPGEPDPGGAGGKSDTFGNRKAGEACSYDYQCSQDLGLNCLDGKVCSADRHAELADCTKNTDCQSNYCWSDDKVCIGPPALVPGQGVHCLVNADVVFCKKGLLCTEQEAAPSVLLCEPPSGENGPCRLGQDECAEGLTCNANKICVK